MKTNIPVIISNEEILQVADRNSICVRRVIVTEFQGIRTTVKMWYNPDGSIHHVE